MHSLWTTLIDRIAHDGPSVAEGLAGCFIDRPLHICEIRGQDSHFIVRLFELVNNVGIPILCVGYMCIGLCGVANMIGEGCCPWQ